MGCWVTLTCATCGQPFNRLASRLRQVNSQWCSKACRAVTQTTRPTVTCDQCGVAFQQKTRAEGHRHNFCSRTCAGLHRRTLGMHTCQMCGTTFRGRSANGSKNLYCSMACWRADQATQRQACLCCGKETRNKKYCSLACWSAAESVTVQCATCGVAMRRWQSKRAAGKGKYCSRACYQRSFTATGPWPIPTSKLERRVRKALDQRGIAYQTDVQIYPYWPDLLFPEQHLIVEIDGDYWHNRPGRPEQDQIRDTALQAQGWQVLRIAEHAIKADLAACVDQIETALQG